MTTAIEARCTGYSMGILWNMDARRLDEDVKAGKELPAPLDGDALARAAAREKRLAEAWEILDAAKIDRLKRNHHLIDRTNR